MHHYRNRRTAPRWASGPPSICGHPGHRVGTSHGWMSPGMRTTVRVRAAADQVRSQLRRAEAERGGRAVLRSTSPSVLNPHGGVLGRGSSLSCPAERHFQIRTVHAHTPVGICSRHDVRGRLPLELLKRWVWRGSRPYKYAKGKCSIIGAPACGVPRPVRHGTSRPRPHNPVTAHRRAPHPRYASLRFTAAARAMSRRFERSAHRSSVPVRARRRAVFIDLTAAGGGVCCVLHPESDTSHRRRLNGLPLQEPVPGPRFASHRDLVATWPGGDR